VAYSVRHSPMTRFYVNLGVSIFVAMFCAFNERHSFCSLRQQPPRVNAGAAWLIPHRNVVQCVLRGLERRDMGGANHDGRSS